MLIDPRVLILLGANALLLHLCLMVNSSLAPFSLYFVLLGPMPVLPALYLNQRSFFLCTVLTGLWVDADPRNSHFWGTHPLSRGAELPPHRARACS